MTGENGKEPVFLVICAKAFPFAIKPAPADGIARIR